MSSQKGNATRSRPQKHKNKTAFKNNLHDTSNRTKQINNLQVSDVCVRCKDIIEWKIKYKKYKPLTQPKKCVKCEQKTVKKAYHVMCTECGAKLGVCTKCCQNKEIVIAQPDQFEQNKLDIEMKNLLATLPERKRRTFLRYVSKKDEDKGDRKVTKQEIDEEKKDFIEKLKALNVEEDDDDFDFEDLDDGDDSEDLDEEDDSEKCLDEDRSVEGS